MTLWRLVHRRFAERAFSGQGTKRAGSRWIPPGYLAVYTAEHLSLAVLEALVHMDPAMLSDNFVVIRCELPAGAQPEYVDESRLPVDWRSMQDDPALHAIGLDWLARNESAALSVPSAIVPMERNVILNPNHADVIGMTIGAPEPFVFDSRLVEGVSPAEAGGNV